MNLKGINASNYDKRTKKERFLSKIDFIPFHSCWEWSGSLDKNGYGSLQVVGEEKP